MTKKIHYFNQEDVLHILISEEAEADSVELSPQITAELNDKGELIGIEILQASEFLRKFILQTAGANHLKMAEQSP